MKIISTLLSCLLFFSLSAQHVMPEIVVVSGSRKIPDRASVCRQVKGAASTGLVFPLKNDLQKALLNAVPCCFLVKQEPRVVVKPVKIQLRCRASEMSDKPLIILDGKPMPVNWRLDSLNPDRIESIDILTMPASAALYGPDGAAGAIIINTKSSAARVFHIKDLLDDAPVSRASITFISPDKKEVFRYAADDSGHLVTNELKRNTSYEMIITAVGYQTLRTTFQNPWFGGKPPVQLLERDIKMGTNVVITCLDCNRIIRCPFFYSVSRRTEPEKRPAKATKETFFPNPARAGQAITLQMEFEKEEHLQVRISQADGKLAGIQTIRAAEGLNRLVISTGAHWAAGTYFVQLIYANGRLAASQPLVIQ